MVDTRLLPIAIEQFRRDWPAMAAKLADLREKALSGAELQAYREISRIAERVPGWTGLPADANNRPVQSMARAQAESSSASPSSRC